MGDVPHTSSVVCPYTGVTHTILLTITGRKPLCLRYNGEGHVRRDCNVPYCRHHEVYGHATESCVEVKLEGRRDGWEFTAEEERRLGGATPRELPTAGRGKSTVRAGRGTSPATRTQVATSAGSIIRDVIVSAPPVGANSCVKRSRDGEHISRTHDEHYQGVEPLCSHHWAIRP